MKRSGYRTIFHIYLIFFISLLGAVLLAGCLFFLTITVQMPDGRLVRSDWPKDFTESFREEIIFADSMPQIKQTGMESLQENEIGIQLLDPSGREVFSYQEPEQAKAVYSGAELLRIAETGKLEAGEAAAFAGTVSNSGNEYAYILFFPVDVPKVTMYVNGKRFASGKTIILPILSVLLLLVLVSGVLYGLFTTKAIKRLISAVGEIAARNYLPVQEHGVFQDLYESLNGLDAEIRAGDQLRQQTEKMREEWIANITHDLKTPLSPVKGYAEILYEADEKSEEQYRRYGQIILKNAAYMETLIDDLKLTYQLDNKMLPVNLEEQNIVRFLKELVIDILNTPEYENRTVHFESSADTISFQFDQRLFTRAFRNLIINAIVHGEKNSEVTLSVSESDTVLKVLVADNGKGMKPETVEHLFDRYYRGTDTGQKAEGSGLGLAIAKGIIELHRGTISVSSVPSVGTAFQMEFPLR